MPTVNTLPPLNLSDVDRAALDETLQAVAGIDVLDYFAPENMDERRGYDVVDTIRWLRANPAAAALGIGVVR